MEGLTVGELKKILENVPDDFPVIIQSWMEIPPPVSEAWKGRTAFFLSA